MRTSIIFAVIVMSAGCERPTLIVDVGGLKSAGQVQVLSRFNPADTVVVGTAGYRVGSYYDFSPFDSLTIMFSAKQLRPGTGSAHLSVRVGPVNYYTDTLLTRQKEVSLTVVCADLAKPRFSALTFFAADPDGQLLLSGLSVVGWTTNP